MIKFTGTFEWHDKKAIVLELEHIGNLILQGRTEGSNWKIIGEEEKEPKSTEIEESLPEEQ